MFFDEIGYGNIVVYSQQEFEKYKELTEERLQVLLEVSYFV